MNAHQIQFCIGHLALTAPPNGVFVVDRSTWDELLRLSGLRVDPGRVDLTICDRRIVWAPWVPRGGLFCASPASIHDFLEIPGLPAGPKSLPQR